MIPSDDLREQRRDYYECAAEGKRPFSDFTWYALDSRGQVAALGSAGFGWIPKPVFTSYDSFLIAHAYFRSSKGPSLWTPDYEGELDDNSGLTIIMEQHGQLGLYVYDFSEIKFGPINPDKYPYRRVLSPTLPLMESELPPAIFEYLKDIRFKDFRFDQARHLWIKESFPEVV